MRLILPGHDGWSDWTPAFTRDGKPNTEDIPSEPGHYCLGMRLDVEFVAHVYCGYSVQLTHEVNRRIRSTHGLWAWVLSYVALHDCYYTFRVADTSDRHALEDMEAEYIQSIPWLVNIRKRADAMYRALESAEILVYLYHGSHPTDVPAVIDEWRNLAYFHNRFWLRDYRWDPETATFVSGKMTGWGNRDTLKQYRRQKVELNTRAVAE